MVGKQFNIHVYRISENVCFGSQAASLPDISPTSASRRKADTRLLIFRDDVIQLKITLATFVIVAPALV